MNPNEVLLRLLSSLKTATLQREEHGKCPDTYWELLQLLSSKTTTSTLVWAGIIFSSLSNITRRQTHSSCTGTHLPNHFYWVNHSWGGRGRGRLNRVLTISSTGPRTWDPRVWVNHAPRCLSVLTCFIGCCCLVQWMPGSSEDRCWWRWLISKRERSLARQRCWEWRPQGAVGWEIHEHWRGVGGHVRGHSLRSVWWWVALTDGRRRVVREQLMELLLKGCHVLMLLLKLGIALVEAL